MTLHVFLTKQGNVLKKLRAETEGPCVPLEYDKYLKNDREQPRLPDLCAAIPTTGQILPDNPFLNPRGQ